MMSTFKNNTLPRFKRKFICLVVRELLFLKRKNFRLALQIIIKSCSKFFNSAPLIPLNILFLSLIISFQLFLNFNSVMNVWVNGDTALAWIKLSAL